MLIQQAAILEQLKQENRTSIIVDHGIGKGPIYGWKFGRKLANTIEGRIRPISEVSSQCLPAEARSPSPSAEASRASAGTLEVSSHSCPLHIEGMFLLRLCIYQSIHYHHHYRSLCSNMMWPPYELGLIAVSRLLLCFRRTRSVTTELQCMTTADD